MAQKDKWTVTVAVPADKLSQQQKDDLFDLIADAVEGWEPENRDGWDANVYTS